MLCVCVLVHVCDVCVLGRGCMCVLCVWGGRVHCVCGLEGRVHVCVMCVSGREGACMCHIMCVWVGRKRVYQRCKCGGGVYLPNSSLSRYRYLRAHYIHVHRTQYQHSSVTLELIPKSKIQLIIRNNKRSC